jgi:hypothetical protein
MNRAAALATSWKSAIAGRRTRCTRGVLPRDDPGRNVQDHRRGAGCASEAPRHLPTLCGLRSLAASDPQYRGRYTGDGGIRDDAYHQGTVWRWLMGLSSLHR